MTSGKKAQSLGKAERFFSLTKGAACDRGQKADALSRGQAKRLGVKRVENTPARDGTPEIHTCPMQPLPRRPFPIARTTLAGLAACVALAAPGASPARAEPLVYEAFEYDLDREWDGLDTSAAGIGEKWREGAVVVPGSLADKDGALPTRGNSAQTGTGWSLTFFNLARALPAADYPRLYVSFLVAADMGEGAPFLLLGREAGGASDAVSIGLAPGAFNWGLSKGWPRTADAQNQVESRVKARPGETVFLVAEIDRTAGEGKVRLWVNPRPGQPMKAAPAPVIMTGLRLPAEFGRGLAFGGDNARFDELRVGTEWSDVTPTARP